MAKSNFLASFLHGAAAVLGLAAASGQPPKVASSSPLAGPLSELGSALTNASGAAETIAQGTMNTLLDEHGLQASTPEADLLLGAVIAEATSLLSSHAPTVSVSPPASAASAPQPEAVS